jgi:CheY-like chemotaxis protein
MTTKMTNETKDMNLQTYLRTPPRDGSLLTNTFRESVPVPTQRKFVAGEDPCNGRLPSPVFSPAAERSMATTSVHNRVLIADDDSLVRGSLAAVLESEGFVVEEAGNGIEAVSRVMNKSPDLILLDLNMPKMDGWTAFAKLDRVRPLVPVIVITARPHQYKEAVQLGVDAFMEKPLNIPILVRAIKRLTSEDENRHVRRITNPAFVTQLLGCAVQ